MEDTLKSISSQNFKSYEHLIVDGGSVDQTISILKLQNRAKWVSREEDETSEIVDAFREAFRMSSGEYIMQCCISDGYLDVNWFRACVEYLEANPNISLVYGLPQYLNANGTFGRVAFHDFFDYPPPSGQEALAFLIATGFLFPEGNYCVRRGVFDKCFPHNSEDDEFKSHPALGFIFNFITRGYIAAFIPRIANYGRLHFSRQVWNRANELPIETLYYRKLRSYGRDIFFNSQTHSFRNESDEIIGVLNIAKFRVQLLKQVLINLKIIRLSPYVIYNKVIDRFRNLFKS